MVKFDSCIMAFLLNLTVQKEAANEKISKPASERLILILPWDQDRLCSYCFCS